MPISVNTNVGALVGQRFLRATDRELQVTQNRLASGLRVSTSVDDASTFAVAQGLRANIKGYVAVEGALGGFKAYASVSVASAEVVSNKLQDVAAKITQLADESLSTAQRTAYQTELNSLTSEIASYITQATYNGTNLLTSATTASVKTVANIDLSTISIAGQGVATTSVSIIGFASATSITNNANAITANNALTTYKGTIDTALSNLGATVKRIDAQNEFINQVRETVEIGLGSLVDADIAKESARLQSLQVRQQLAVSALGIANGQPQALLGLLR
jgi:flagellin